MTNWQSVVLENIANELKNIREILEKQQTNEQSPNFGEWLDRYMQDDEEDIELTEAILGSLPTIEVSEDCSDHYKGYCSKYDDGCFHQCEDCISRKGLIDSFLADNECDTREEAKACMCSLDLMLELIEDAPSVIPKPKEGEWIYCEDYIGHDGYKCSKCGFFIPWCYDVCADSNFIRHYHTCPSCGAKMKGANK